MKREGKGWVVRGHEHLGNEFMEGSNFLIGKESGEDQVIGAQVRRDVDAPGLVAWPRRLMPAR